MARALLFRTHGFMVCRVPHFYRWANMPKPNRSSPTICRSCKGVSAIPIIESSALSGIWFSFTQQLVGWKRRRAGRNLFPASRIPKRVGGSSKGEIGARSKGETLQRIISQDFRPGILGWARRLGHGPELAERMVDEGDGSALGWRNGPAPAEEVDLEVGIDAAAQVERQVQVQQGGGRARPDGRALLQQGFGPSGIGTQAGGAADGGILVGDLAIQDDLSGGVIADVFIGQERHQALLPGSETTFDFSFCLRASEGSPRRGCRVPKRRSILPLACGLGATRWVTPKAEKARWNSEQGSRSSAMESWPKRLRPSV